MIVTLQTQGLQSLEQVKAFPDGADGYGFIAQTLTRFRYLGSVRTQVSCQS